MGNGAAGGIDQALSLSKAIIDADVAKYNAVLKSKTEKEAEDTKRMSALFTLVGETNKGALDTIKDLNARMVELDKVLLDSNMAILKEYQLTLRSLGQNLADQSKNFGEILKSAAALDKGVQKMAVETGKSVCESVKESLTKCFSMVTKLAEKHDARMADLTKDIIAKMSITEKVLTKIIENNDNYMTLTTSVLTKYADKI